MSEIRHNLRTNKEKLIEELTKLTELQKSVKPDSNEYKFLSNQINQKLEQLDKFKSGLEDLDTKGRTIHPETGDTHFLKESPKSEEVLEPISGRAHSEKISELTKDPFHSQRLRVNKNLQELDNLAKQYKYAEPNSVKQVDLKKRIQNLIEETRDIAKDTPILEERWHKSPSIDGVEKALEEPKKVLPKKAPFDYSGDITESGLTQGELNKLRNEITEDVAKKEKGIGAAILEGLSKKGQSAIRKSAEFLGEHPGLAKGLSIGGDIAGKGLKVLGNPVVGGLAEMFDAESLGPEEGSEGYKVEHPEEKSKANYAGLLSPEEVEAKMAALGMNVNRVRGEQEDKLREHVGERPSPDVVDESEEEQKKKKSVDDMYRMLDGLNRNELY